MVCESGIEVSLLENSVVISKRCLVKSRVVESFFFIGAPVKEQLREIDVYKVRGGEVKCISITLIDGVDIGTLCQEVV